MSKKRMNMVNPVSGKNQVCAKFTDKTGIEKVIYVRGTGNITTVNASDIALHECKNKKR